MSRTDRKTRMGQLRFVNTALKGWAHPGVEEIYEIPLEFK